MKQQVNDNIMYVKMFGKLELTYLGKSITSDDIRSEMAEVLLTYMLSHHEKEVTTQTICEQLWEDDESDNPMGALKNLMYRLRNTLKKVWDEDFILTGRGSYHWNPNIALSIDCERMDAILSKATDTKRNLLLEEVIELYQDVFLPKYRRHHWVIQIGTYYQSRYINIVEKLASYYLFEEEYQKLEALCNQALKFDEFDVSIHYLLLQAYIKQNKKQVAIEYYKALTKLLMDELGITVSDKIKSLYTELLKSENHTEMDLSVIEEDLREFLRPTGAFVCEYGVFKEIYRLQSRQSSRMGMAVYCVLLSADILLDIPSTSEMYKKIMKNSMMKIEELLLSMLRVGDTASRYSVSQYVVLLPTCTYESSIMVMERLKHKFSDWDKQKKINLVYEVRELKSGMEEEHGERM